VERVECNDSSKDTIDAAKNSSSLIRIIGFRHPSMDEQRSQARATAAAVRGREEKHHGSRDIRADSCPKEKYVGDDVIVLSCTNMFVSGKREGHVIHDWKVGNHRSAIGMC
jgi:hypothetical protein